MPLRDRFGRVIEYLRVSVTERCNMRCVYCVSPDQRIYEPHGEQLSFEEIATVVRTLAPHGLRRVRITGGEPLVRPHIPELVGMLAQIPGITDLSLSTNGILLPRYADALKRNGLKRVNISLDTLQPLKFRQISPAGRWEDVWAGIEAALAVGLSPVKLNCVLMKGINDDEILDLARLTLNQPLHVRFIELMPIGNLAFYRQGHMLPISEAKARCAQLGELIPVVQGEAVGGGPAEVFRLPGAQGTLGFIGACTANFCHRCNRMRLSADGYLYPCLGHGVRVDLKPALQLPQGQREEAILSAVERALHRKPVGHQFVALLPHPIFRTMRAIGG
ncbi:GTP 3',8-cyclase [bacterium HR15]|nr:GTP 3',8-cyclase [bacterium HR15]